MASTQTCSENGEFIKEVFINNVKPACVICDGKPATVLGDEFLMYNCNCYGCSSNVERICKKCAINTVLFTHLCNCFRQSTRHGWYNLKEIWEKTGL